MDNYTPMNKITTLISIIIVVSITTISFAQDKKYRYFDENENEITYSAFLSKRDNQKNLGVFYKNDSTQFGIIVNRTNYGKLNKSQLNNLRTHLVNSGKDNFKHKQYIIINYLSDTPEPPKKIKKATWSIFDKDYPNKIIKKGKTIQLWVCSPENNNLSYYHEDKINWYKDNNLFFKETFFPYDINFGSFVVINLKGEYISYYGEYSKHTVYQYHKNMEKEKKRIK